MAILSSNQINTIDAFTFMEADHGNNTFIYNTFTFPFQVSQSTYEKQLERGGFKILKSIFGTVRKYNIDGSSVFANTTLPKVQEKVVHRGITYRIMNMEHDSWDIYFDFYAIQDVGT